MAAYVSAKLRQRIRDDAAERCAYCCSSEHLIGVTFEIDHITPQSAGGSTEFENLCLTCPMCNRYKLDATNAVDPVSGEEVRLFHPRHDSWDAHFYWLDDGTVLGGLTEIGRATIVAL